jgi:diaminopimelate decarboxylase
MGPILSDAVLLKAAADYGTPLYVYDRDRIVFQYQQLKQAFRQTPTRFFYACKALTNVNVLKVLADEGSGIDCVSINEVRLALLAGFTPDRIIFTPNSVGMDEYQEAVSMGVHINIDNLNILKSFGLSFGNSYPVIVRLNPHIMAGGNLKISTGHVDSKFGISVDQVQEIIQIMKETNLLIKGLHLHTGSEIKDLEVFLKGLDLVLDLSHQFQDLSIIDLGGGFKVPYKPGEKGTEMEELGKRLNARVSAFSEQTGKSFEVWFEPGKFLVSQCGYLLVKTNIIKEGPSRVFIGVNSGFNHLIRPMFYDAYHEIRNVSNPAGPIKTYNVVGNICETDTFAWDRELNEVRGGDLLVFNNAGAYGFEMSSRFNSRCRPAEVLIENDQPRIIRKRETFDDILNGVVFS